MSIDNTANPTGPARMIVAPEKLLHLKQGFEDERDRIANWLRENWMDLRHVDPPGSDPSSKDTMALMSQNGAEAVNAITSYVDRLTNIVNNLHDDAVSYGLIEDDNAHGFRQGLT
ncbi:hypothetical protein BLA60_11965 [Actinophytocola xinjiangensis]|uniref:PE domain-containing protein n=1 Tax=Actinophytocola xinjiangensis TaxID=485602 RepID=A0A7Z1AZW2_9PSEU|nr:PE domain-containing protein [Actinophytocola xinjiangensis]OLF11643.1 hypothetical protein BLA60_11965 [Actinophytocola xinjiangensis]